MPLDVSLREMFSVSNIETLLFGLPKTCMLTDSITPNHVGQK